MDRRRRRHSGLRVNPRIDPIKPPGWWVTDRECEGCGEQYDDHRSGANFQDAANELRMSAKSAGDEGGGYRSRGSVLWVMRVHKLNSWYLEHVYCQDMAQQQWAAK